LVFNAYTDGSVRGGNPGRAAWAWVVYKSLFVSEADPCWMRFRDAACLPGLNSNNYAEYRAVINVLRWWKMNKDIVRLNEDFIIHCDSELVVKQLLGSYSVSDAMYPLFHQAKTLLTETGAQIKWIRGHSGDPGNEAVDALVNVVQDERDKVLKPPTGFSTGMTWY
jgi:ribonuclease HI